MPSDLAESFLTRRKALGLSQAEVARRSGTQQRQVSLFERGGDVTLATLNKLAQALDMELAAVPREHAAKVAVMIASPRAAARASASASLLDRYQVRDDEAASGG